MSLRCPYCAEEIMPSEIQCPSCATPYDLETILLITNLAREALSVDFHEPREEDEVLLEEWRVHHLSSVLGLQERG